MVCVVAVDVVECVCVDVDSGESNSLEFGVNVFFEGVRSVGLSQV